MALRPESEFIRELSFRTKVYKMLAYGFSPADVEDILDCNIDWSFFSQDTVDSLRASEERQTDDFSKCVLECVGESRMHMETLKQRWVSTTIDIDVIRKNMEKASTEIEQIKVNSCYLSNKIDTHFRFVKVCMYLFFLTAILVVVFR